jgi:putative FmdB family regulatory protein
MPKYDYKCKDCGREITISVSIHEKTHSVSDCALCHGEFKRIYTATPVTFKGSGFYKTDSA